MPSVWVSLGSVTWAECQQKWRSSGIKELKLSASKKTIVLFYIPTLELQQIVTINLVYRTNGKWHEAFFFSFLQYCKVIFIVMATLLQWPEAKTHCTILYRKHVLSLHLARTVKAEKCSVHLSTEKKNHQQIWQYRNTCLAVTHSCHSWLH